MKVRVQNADGSFTESEFQSDELDQYLLEAQKYWRELAMSGTPYWCIHEGRNINHRSAYYQDDGEHDGIHHKHGIRCRDCGGYIQEG